MLCHRNPALFEYLGRVCACVLFSKVMEITNHLRYPTKQYSVKTNTTVIQELIKIAIWEICKI